MSMEYIRNTYGVPAKRGARVEYANQWLGTITGSDGARIRIRLDGRHFSMRFHPKWKIKYLNEQESK